MIVNTSMLFFFLLGSLFHSSLHLSLFLALPPLLCEFVCVYMYYTYVRMGVCIAGCWPMSFWRFYHLCLPSLWKNTGFTNMCWHTQLYVASGASNSGADTHTHSKQFRDRAISYTYTHSIFTYIYTHTQRSRDMHTEKQYELDTNVFPISPTKELKQRGDFLTHIARELWSQN